MEKKEIVAKFEEFINSLPLERLEGVATAREDIIWRLHENVFDFFPSNHRPDNFGISSIPFFSSEGMADLLETDEKGSFTFDDAYLEEVKALLLDDSEANADALACALEEHEEQCQYE